MNSLDLISQTQANLTATASWSEIETLLFEVMLDKVGDKINSDDVTYLMTTYKSLCDLRSQSQCLAFSCK